MVGKGKSCVLRLNHRQAWGNIVSFIAVTLTAKKKFHSHLEGTRGTQVRLEDILKTFSGSNVNLQGLTTPLDEMLVRAIEGLYLAEGASIHTRDSALGFSNWVADISAGQKDRTGAQSKKNTDNEIGGAVRYTRGVWELPALVQRER